MDDSYIYHLVQEARWKETGGEGYLPPTYSSDGFIHATKEAELLLPVANHFYTDVPGNFICLRIDTTKLEPEVKFEAAGPVGDKPAHSIDKAEDTSAGPPPGQQQQQQQQPSQQPLFPHIYGPINPAAVVAELAVKRSDAGAFLSIEGLLC